MADRLNLITAIGARIAALEGSDDVATQAVLKMALAAIVEDAGVIAQAERRKAKDRRRKAGEDEPAPARSLALVPPVPPAPVSSNGDTGGNSQNSAHSADSEHSADSAESGAQSNGVADAHITRALGLEVQEQDQKQKQGSPNGLPVASPNGAADAEGLEALGDAYRAGAEPPPFDPSWAIWQPGCPDPSPAKIRRAVDFVIAKYLERHPRRRPGDADRKLIARHFKRYTPAELAEAIDGNADDEWARNTGKHELSWTLRNNGQIDNYRLKATASAHGAEQLAETVQKTGWF